MQKITPDDPVSKTTDHIQENIAKLKELFPELVTEGAKGHSVNVDVLKQLIGDQTLTDAEEKYGLNWHGKRKARQLALTPSTGTLRPCPEDSVDWDNTQNLMIEGDNLEVLKLLQKSYAGKVKLIYIDPPYNTGGDFVYPDNFHDNMKNYLELTGQLGEGKKLSSNLETSGRFHTDWLTMIYPRLKLARNLLREDGVVIVHMDEHEHSNCSAILGEVFGSENILGAAVWDKKNPKGDSTRLAYQHESLFFVAKNKAEFAAKGGLTRCKKNAEAILEKAKQLFARIGKYDLPADLKECTRRYDLEESCVSQELRQITIDSVNREFADWIKKQGFSGGEAAYSKIDENGNVYRLVSMAWPNKKKAPDDYFIPLVHPITGKACPVPERGWRNPPETMKKLLESGEILFGSDHTTQPQRKYMLSQNIEENFPSVIGYGGSDDALLAELGIPFDNPKPLELARDLIATGVQTGGIVMDFFAGSGTVGHAVIADTSHFKDSTRFILVQLPEPLDREDKDQKIAANFCEKINKPLNIAELTKERLRRAGKKIKEENPMFSGDTGFRVFKLDSTNIREWDPDRENLAVSLEESVDHLKSNRTDDDILFELLLKLGLDLCVPMEQRSIAGKTVHSIGAGALITCLDKSITRADAEPLALGILAWLKELNTAGESTLVFRDSGFVDDVAKTNLSKILEQNGIAAKNIRSL